MLLLQIWRRIILVGGWYVCVFNQYFLNRKMGLLITRALEFLEFKEGFDYESLISYLRPIPICHIWISA